jgi:hypothetical protein
MSAYASTKMVEEIRGKFFKEIEELQQNVKKLSLQINTSGEKSTIELE